MRMSVGILSAIHGPADVHALDAAELPALCGEIRTTLVRYGHVHGGHIGSNLGMVEATVALHRVFDSPRDRIVFDVSHQSYVHKMLTGRADAYLDPAHHDSVTGFTNPAESAHDQFVLGHTGTSISLACGLAKSRDLAGGMDGGSGIRNVIAVIGDGSLSSAIAFEGLNNAAEQGGNLIIIVNDNEMSIAEDHGGMYGTLARLRATGGKGGPNLFMAFGLDYRYVEAGNDVFALIEAFEQVKDTDHPVVVHIHTRKGLGLPPAKESAEARDSGIPMEGDAAVAAEDSMVSKDDMRRTIGRIPTARPGGLWERASITGAWRWRHWNRGSPRNLDWWSSPPRRRARTASPARSGNGPDGTTSIPASPKSTPWRSPRASHGPADDRCWPLPRRSSSARSTSCSRSCR